MIKKIFFILLTLAVGSYLLYWLFTPVQVKGTSMEPSYPNQAYCLTNKLTYLFASPKRGDAVVYEEGKKRLPRTRRIVGLPGERVRYENGQVYINGQLLDEPYAKLREKTSAWGAQELQFELAEAEYLVLPDDRIGSAVSLEDNIINRQTITAKLWLKLL